LSRGTGRTIRPISDFAVHEFEDIMTTKKTLLAFAFTLVFAIALPLRAQTGCDDSPEDPTIALALVGGAGALLAGVWRPRRR
jgi:XrtJ-associated TM-motif-TM protein